MTSRGRFVLLACAGCEDIFSRRVSDVGRARQAFCGAACQADARRTGRAMVEVPCFECGASLRRSRWLIARQERFYCAPCYQRTTRIAQYGRLGGLASQAKTGPVERFLRGQRGGFARARALTRERIQEIGRQAAAARLTRGARSLGDGRAARMRLGLSWVGPVVVRRRQAEG